MGPAGGKSFYNEKINETSSLIFSQSDQKHLGPSKLWKIKNLPIELWYSW